MGEMQRSSGSIRQAWVNLKRPEAGQGHAAIRVPGTNAWVFKSAEGGFGLLLSGVHPPAVGARFRNITLAFKEEKIVVYQGGSHPLRRCLEVELNPSCDQDTLARVIERLSEDSPSGAYSSELLQKTLHDVAEVVKPAAQGPTKERILGAWGELYVLMTLVRAARLPIWQRRIIECWERGGEARDIVDFRFEHARAAIEVKTGLGDRVHRFHGYGQLEIPAGFTSGHVASILAVERVDGSGLSCSNLVQQIEGGLSGAAAERAAAKDALRAVVELRGQEALDERFRFDVEAGGLSFYKMAAVPRPLAAPGVSDVAWSADLRDLVPEPSPVWAGLIDAIVRPRVAPV